MELELPVELAASYKSPTQRVRVITEAWGESNLYCTHCTSPRLSRAPHSTKAFDFACPQCDSHFQLKSQSRPITNRLADADYATMRQTILSGRTPNLLALHYDPDRWKIQTLLLIPRFVFSLSAVTVRNPTRPKGRHSAWIGCDFILANIASDAKIPMVLDGRPTDPRRVREQYKRLLPLQNQRVENRGWTVDVLNAVRSIGKGEFTLSEVYAYTERLQTLHPKNRHVQDKIRQQMQRLRDLGFLEFVHRGHYRLRS